MTFQNAAVSQSNFDSSVQMPPKPAPARPISDSDSALGHANSMKRGEFKYAVRGLGMCFTRWKYWRAMIHADLNRYKSVDGDEKIEELIKYAVKRRGIVVT